MTLPSFLMCSRATWLSVFILHASEAWLPLTASRHRFLPVCHIKHTALTDTEQEMQKDRSEKEGASASDAQP